MIRTKACDPALSNILAILSLRCGSGLRPGEHAMQLIANYLKRYKDIHLLFLQYCKLGMHSKVADDAEAGSSNGSGDVEAKSLPDDLERLGPTFVKLGQLLSSRPDILPPRYLKALARLQD